MIFHHARPSLHGTHCFNVVQTVESHIVTWARQRRSITWAQLRKGSKEATILDRMNLLPQQIKGGRFHEFIKLHRKGYKKVDMFGAREVVWSP